MRIIHTPAVPDRRPRQLTNVIMNEQIDEVIGKNGKGDLNKLLRGRETLSRSGVFFERLREDNSSQGELIKNEPEN